MKKEASYVWQFVLNATDKRKMVAKIMAKDYFRDLKTSDMDGIKNGLYDMLSDEDDIYEKMVERYEDEIEDECNELYDRV